MKIAGTTADAEEREEIEDIVKVFLIAQRMKSLYSRKSQKKAEKSSKSILVKTIILIGINFHFFQLEDLTSYYNLNPSKSI